MKTVTVEHLLSLVCYLEKLQSREIVDFAAVISAYSVLAKLGAANRKEVKANTSAIQSALNCCNQSAPPETCSDYGSGMFSKCERPDEYDMRKILVNGLTEKWFADMQSLRDDRVKMLQTATLLECAGERLERLRNWILETQKAKNQFQAEVLSVLMALPPETLWKKRIGHYHHFYGIHGSALNRLEDWKLSGRKIRQLQGNRKLEGRVSKTRGIDTLNRVRSNLGEVNHATYWIPNQYCTDTRWSRVFQSNTPKHVTPECSALQSLVENGILGYVSYRDYRFLPGLIRLLESFCGEFGICCVGGTRSQQIAGLVRQAIAVHRLHRSQAGNAICRAGVEHQLILTPWSEFADIEVNGNYCKVLSRQVVIFAERYKHGRAIHSPEVVRELSVQRSRNPNADLIWERVQTVHVDLLHTDCTAELAKRFTQEVENQRRRAVLSGQPILSPRQSIARLLVRMLKLQTVTLQDSYASGNCAPGTSEFCRKLGIQSESVSGGELARKWKAAGYPQNDLFARVIVTAENRQKKVGC